ncbi:MAG: hypothetical protein HFF71_09760 [Oscillospiraceae bacterium]|nr:hypothetical protein [Oscillospiraceae bacterium]
MLQIERVKLELEEDESLLRHRAAAALRIPEADVLEVQILRRAVDAREGVRFVYTLRAAVRNEKTVLKRCKNKNVSPVSETPYHLPDPIDPPEVPPVVVGAGPGGLFCALALARCGARPILLERGWNVERRAEDVERFWKTGTLDPESNVQFGEGGAGTFSDGKLNTGTRDMRHRFILETLTAHGAPESILYDARPHVGTDYLRKVLVNLRQELTELGCDIRFGHRLTGLELKTGSVAALEVTGPEGPYRLPAENVVLALGNGARDTFEMLHTAGVPMEPKPLAVGVRIEHRQSDIDLAQYKSMAGHPRLPASSYKLSCHLENGRGVFSFCVCPGGEVVAAASEEARAVTNGMSRCARDGENCNGGLLASVTPADFPGNSPLAGIAFQRELEARAYAAGGGGYIAPAQRVEDFLLRRPSRGPGKVRPTYRPGVRWCDLWEVLPEWLCESLAEALPILDKKVKGYAGPDAVLTAVESRSSCPLRILRDENARSPIGGLWPCGEGAGYAGGIMSAAADGLKTAEQILKSAPLSTVSRSPLGEPTEKRKHA